MTQGARRLSNQEQDSGDRTDYVPGEDPREFGRRVAQDVFTKHVLPLLEKDDKHDDG